MSGDLYEALGVPRTASSEDVKKAYYAIARSSHPDRNPGDSEAEARFKAAAEAYRVLGDPDARRRYDAARGESADVGPARGARRVDGRRATVSGRSVAKSRFRERGDDLKYTVRLPFEQAALGSRERLQLPDERTCEACGGTGAAPGMPSGPCPDCDGKGQRASPGFFRQTDTCPTCRGTGQVVRHICSTCAGLGTRPAHREVVVDIPAGVENGARLRISGQGRPGSNGGPAGDLIVVVDVEAHPFFVREHDDILVEVPISFGQAAIGAQVEIPTLQGKMKLHIPAGTQTGRIFRLKGHGLRRPGKEERGDQKVRVVVETPEGLDDAQRALMEQWVQLESPDGEHRVGRYRAAIRKLYS